VAGVDQWGEGVGDDGAAAAGDPGGDCYSGVGAEQPVVTPVVISAGVLVSCRA
jgi:hypothetical protein